MGKCMCPSGGGKTHVLLAAAHGTGPVLASLERAVAFSRWRAADVRSILATNAGTPTDPRRSSTRVDLADGADQVAGHLQDRRQG
jgi:hypothetical protein